MMKRLAVLLPAAVLMAGVLVYAEELQSEAAEEAVTEEVQEAGNGLVIDCAIEDGSYVIRIPAADGDEGWMVNETYLDDTVLQVGSAEVLDDVFEARIDPVGDGQATVVIDQNDGIACVKRMTWDLLVENGEVTECTGGSNGEAPAEEEVDPYLSGEWIEEETQMTQMSIEKNPDKGWHVEIAAPLSHGAYVFTANVFFDCNTDAFIYNDGAFYEVPITDSEEQELGDPVQTDTTGLITFAGNDEENLKLIWFRGQEEDELVTFVRMQEE